MKQTTLSSVVTSLRVLGFLAIVAASACLLGTFFIDSDIYRAFCLGAFFTSLVGIILLFGFAKVIELLGEIRDHARSQTAPDRGA